MVRIVRPEDRAVQQSAQISESVAGSSVQGAGAIAEAEIQAGRQFQDTQLGNIGRNLQNTIADENARIFQETQLARQNALYTQKFAEGAKLFMARKQERESTILDEDGNPTFGSLVDDVGLIGESVINEITASVKDPAVAEKLSNNLLNYISNQQIASLGAAKAQELEFATASLKSGLDDLSNLALSDSFDNIGTYELQVQEMLSNAVQSGVIGADDARRIGDGFSQTARKQSLANLIADDLDVSNAMLSNSPEALGISETDYRDLKELHSARAEDANRALKQHAAEQEREQAARRADAFNEMQLGITAGVVQKADILNQKGVLSDVQLNALLKAHESRTKADDDKLEVYSKIDEAIVSKSRVSDVASASYIGQHYKDATSGSKPDGSSYTMTDRAIIASRYNAPVGEFATEMEYITEFGDAGNARDLLQAFGEIKSRGSPALSTKFSNTAESVLNLAERYAEIAGMSPSDALTAAREKVYNATPEEKAARKANFTGAFLGSDKALNKDRVAESLASRMSSIFEFGDPSAIDITPEAVATYRDLVELEFYETGDKSASLDIAAEKMKKNYGMSTINGVTRFMKHAPEVVYGVPSETIQASLNKDLGKILPSGIDSSSVQLVSDQLTRGVFETRPDGTQKEVIRYAISYVDAAGIRRLLLDDNGSIIRWGL